MNFAPFAPLKATDIDGNVKISVWGRDYVQNRHYFPDSMTTQGRELLYAPMRLTGIANEEPIIWEDEGCYLLSESEEKAIVNGYAQSQCLIVNSCIQYDYDGGARWDIRVMPRGKTVAQEFGLAPITIKGWELTELNLEIPLKKEGMTLYNTWRAAWDGDNGVHQGDNPLPENGGIPKGGIQMPFMPSVWLGDEKAGFSLCTESDELWQPKDKESAIEIKDCGDHWLLTYHLLSSLPKRWKHPDMNSTALSWSFGLMTTPVKPFNNDYLKMRAVHIDCFIKVQGDYWPFLNGSVSDENPETVIDRLCEAGVNVLILHEKWNTIQNNWNVPVNRAKEIHKIVELCHSRGIKVIPYFGYEITSAMPEYSVVRDEVTNLMDGQDYPPTAWYRVPYQRANRVCYNTEWADKLVEGMMNCLDTFHFDGVYLDGTTNPNPCCNLKHGCGYVDEEGKAHSTFPMFSRRAIMQKICGGVHDRGGIVNPHPGGATIPFIYSGTDLLWDGEHLQTRIRDEGLSNFSLEYYRSEYLGVNLGIPAQFIVYEFGDTWTFDMALSLCMIHGTYPRPNAVWHPLDVMEKVWNITGTFGIWDATFCGYWENAQVMTTSDDNCKVSFYERKMLNGETRLLVLLGNPTTRDIDALTVTIHPEAFGKKTVVSAYNAMNNCDMALPISLPMPAFGSGMIEVILK